MAKLINADRYQISLLSLLNNLDTLKEDDYVRGFKDAIRMVVNDLQIIEMEMKVNEQ